MEGANLWEVKVIFVGTSLHTCTKGEKEAKVLASTLGEIINKLVRRYGNEFKKAVLDSSGTPKSNVQFFINGANVYGRRATRWQEIPLSKGDEIFLLPQVARGG